MISQLERLPQCGGDYCLLVETPLIFGLSLARRRKPKSSFEKSSLCQQPNRLPTEILFSRVCAARVPFCNNKIGVCVEDNC